MVRVVRLERTVSWSQTRRDTNFAIPGYSLFCHDTTASGKNKDFSVCGHSCGQSRFYATFSNRVKPSKRRCHKALRRFALSRPGYRHGTPKRRRGRDGSAAWSPSHDALRQPVPARPSARQGISAACILRRCDAAERLQAHGPLHAHRPARPTAAGCGGGLSARVFADGGRGRAAPGEAAAEAVDGRVVPLGVFQPAQRYPDTGLAGPVGVKLRSILL